MLDGDTTDKKTWYATFYFSAGRTFWFFYENERKAWQSCWNFISSRSLVEPYCSELDNTAVAEDEEWLRDCFAIDALGWMIGEKLKRMKLEKKINFKIILVIKKIETKFDNWKDWR